MPLSNHVPSSRLLRPGVCTFATRPSSPYDGQMIYETDTDRVLVWNGSSWKLVDDPTWVPITTSSMSNQIVSFSCERNGVPTVGANYAFGNGATVTTMSIPFAGKLVAATFTASTDINNSITVRPYLNTALVATTWQMIVSNTTQVATYNFYSNPLSIPAGQRFAWQCTAVAATAGSTVITFYIQID